MRFLIVAILLATLIFFTPVISANPGEIVVSDADTVWSANLVGASADVIDASDAPPQTLAEAFVSHADTVWSTGLQPSTSPTISNVSPQDGAADIRIDTVITATFSEAMDSSTINAESFTLAGSAVSGTVTYDPATYTATFTPDADLEYDHEYTATLSTAITDLAGNPLAEPYTWSFTSELTPSQPPEGLLDVKFFSQKDPAWSDIYLDNSPYTIGNSGCALTSLAMIVKYFGYDADPARLNTSLTEAEGIDASGNICDWSKVEEVSSEQVKWIDSVEASWEKIDQELNEKYPVICSVKTPLDPPLDIHFIVFIGKVGNKYYFLDPLLDPLDAQKGIREWPKGKYEYTIDANRRLKIYRPNRPPICAVELQKNGMPIDSVDVGGVFGICAGNSTDDFGIEEVRFSSDDFQDGAPTGEWTAWYDWGTSSGDWNAATKIKGWSFATGGKKEVWAEIKDDGGKAAQDHANIFAHPGYAIIVAGQGGLTDRQWFGHSADNAYRALHNLGFDDDHIFYLNSQRQLEINGRDVVDLNATKSDFDYAINQIKLRIKDRPTPFVLYLVGHGGQGIFVFDPEWEGIENVSDFGLRQMLEDIPLDPAFIAIWTCDAGGFITLDFSQDSISVEGENRIIVTGAHESDTLRMYDLARSSDRLWGNLNTGLNVREAFVGDATQADVDHRLLDDNGDQEGNPPNNLRSDGELAARIIIGVPSSYELALVPWYQALIHSAGELRVYDSQNRVTGLFNGEVKQEIPDSIYDEENETVAIFSPCTSCRYEVVGTGEGTYGLEIASIEGSEATTFTASDIPTVLGAVHQYTIDWDALSEGEEGVTIQVDSDGDGDFEDTFTSDNELTRREFVVETTPPAPPMVPTMDKWGIIAMITLFAGLLVWMVRRRPLAS
jgi:hypothetical protein